MVTVSALDIRNAASSGLPDLTLRCSCPPSCAAPPSEPKPPKITLKNERFMALHMMYDRIAHDDPTSEPAMISMGLLSEKTMHAAAPTESLFGMEMTNGMSAPP